MKFDENKPCLGILASKNARSADYLQGLRGLIGKFPHVLEKYNLLVTGGTFNDIFSMEERDPLDIGKDAWNRCASEFGKRFSGEILRRGKDGGLIQLSEAVRSEKARVVIFFIDPRDVEENFPENQELFRMCAMCNAILLINYRSASLWANNEALGARKAKDIPPANKRDKDTTTLALIAHDKKKLDMCHFVVKHREKLNSFDRIITTGTTGKWVSEFLGLFNNVNPLVELKESGPIGGDVMISNEILENKCQHVCFFLDPETAHPHEADIFALFRTCTFRGVDVNLRMTYHAAESWIQTI